MGTIIASVIFVRVQATYSIEDLAKQLEQVGSKVVVATEDIMPKLLKASEVAPREFEKVYLFDKRMYGSATASHWTELAANEETARDFTCGSLNSRNAAMRTASLIYSSGSTGFPKGVELSHLNNCICGADPWHPCSSPECDCSGEGVSALLCYMSMSQVVG